MFCEHCGASIDADSKFCANCGNSIAEGPVALRSARSYALRGEWKKSPKKLQAVLILSIPTAFILLIVVWFLTGIVGEGREGFEKFLPDGTVFYTEVYDPIGLILNLEKSPFFKRLSATQTWKELENSNQSFRNYKDTLASMVGLRTALGPLGLAFIPSFSDEAPLFYVRVKKDYGGTIKTGLEKFLEGQGLKFRVVRQAGRIRYDLETPHKYSVLLTDFGVLGGPADLLDKYVDWIIRQRKADLLNAPNYRKVVQTPGGTAFARVFYHSALLESAVGKVGDPSVLKIFQNFPEWISKTDLELSNGGILLKSSMFVKDKRLVEASKKPISNRSLKYLPRNAVALATLNLAMVVEFAKDEIRRSGAEGRERQQIEKLLETLQGEGLVSLVPDRQGQLSEGSFLLAVQQRQPSASAKTLGDLLREPGLPPQVTRYGAHEITCFVHPLCFTEIEDFLFLSPNEGLIRNVADVIAGKAPGFQDALKSDGTLKRFLGNQSTHGVVYIDLKGLLPIGVLNWGGAQEVRLKERLQSVAKPFYMAQAISMRGEVFEGRALLAADFSELGDLLIELAEGEQFSQYKAHGIDADVKSALRNAATAQEAFFVRHLRYTTRLEDLIAAGLTLPPGVTLRIDRADGRGFMLTARKPGGTVSSWSFDSRTGMLTPGRPVQSGALR